MIIISVLYQLFSRSKWLPPPLRKLSQGRVDKTSSSERPLVKKPSDKSFKLPTEKQTEDALKALPASHSTAAQDLEQEEESTFELPPPMKPIQDSQSSMMANGPTVSAVVEQDLGKRVKITTCNSRSVFKISKPTTFSVRHRDLDVLLLIFVKM